ncbi:hypothetical protein [Arcanobacterium hippocoleae]|uniref:hypothetical protein n=1 Tax=Arcanobacterium hippocoleae TaxID=149017 RepID=UPI00333F9B49
MRSFTLDALNSERDLGLRITSPIEIPENTRSVDYLSVDGRDGALVTKGAWLDRETTITVAFSDLDHFTTHTTPALYKARRLILPVQPDRFYRVGNVEIGKITRLLSHLWQAELAFHLAPFNYHLSNNPITATGSMTITNPGTTTAQPLIMIESKAAEVEFTLNKTVVRVEMKIPKILLDCELKEALTPNGTRFVNQYLHGQFPVLIPGENQLDLATADTTLTITVNPKDL